MKESIGGIFLFNIVILFILLFTGIMTLTINRSRAFSVKDEIIAEIERSGVYQGSSNGQLQSSIVEAMEVASYRSEGTCSSEEYSAYSREGELTGGVGLLSTGSICIREVSVNTSEHGFAGEGGCYFSIELFYKIDVPLIENALNFTVKGETKVLYDECTK